MIDWLLDKSIQNLATEKATKNIHRNDALGW